MKRTRRDGLSRDRLDARSGVVSRSVNGLWRERLYLEDIVSLTYRILFHNFLFTYRNYRPTRTKVYHLSLRWRSWSLNDPHNEKNNMDHPSRIKTHRLPDYTGPTSAYAPLTVQRADRPSRRTLCTHAFWVLQHAHARSDRPNIEACRAVAYTAVDRFVTMFVTHRLQMGCLLHSLPALLHSAQPRKRASAFEWTSGSLLFCNTFHL